MGQYSAQDHGWKEKQRTTEEYKPEAEVTWTCKAHLNWIKQISSTRVNVHVPAWLGKKAKRSIIGICFEEWGASQSLMGQRNLENQGLSKMFGGPTNDV